MLDFFRPNASSQLTVTVRRGNKIINYIPTSNSNTKSFEKWLEFFNAAHISQSTKRITPTSFRYQFVFINQPSIENTDEAWKDIKTYTIGDTMMDPKDPTKGVDMTTVKQINLMPLTTQNGNKSYWAKEAVEFIIEIIQKENATKEEQLASMWSLKNLMGLIQNLSPAFHEKERISNPAIYALTKQLIETITIQINPLHEKINTYSAEPFNLLLFLKERKKSNGPNNERIISTEPTIQPTEIGLPSETISNNSLPNVSIEVSELNIASECAEISPSNDPKSNELSFSSLI